MDRNQKVRLRSEPKSLVPTLTFFLSISLSSAVNTDLGREKEVTVQLNINKTLFSTLFDYYPLVYLPFRDMLLTFVQQTQIKYNLNFWST